MAHEKPIQIIDLAIKGACIKIDELQRQIQLIERFGNKAMINENFYHPENLKRNAILYDISKILDSLENTISLAAELKQVRENYFDKKFDSEIKSFFQ